MALTNVFRTDGWVKSAQGPAVPGAQVYVCLQPANVASLPPTPLANIFSDVNGLVPIQQPILTDGFGHYDFYAAANVYTVIIGLGGLIQQVYPDQSVGGASGTSGGGGGTALNLQVGGTPNVNQLLLNLVGQNSVAVADQGNGTVNITGSVFQTNGTANTLQSVLNLKAGANVSLTADALGGVTIAGASSIVSGSNVWTAGFGGWVSSNPAPRVCGGDTLANMLPGRLATCMPGSWKVTFTAASGATVKLTRCSIAVCNADSETVNSHAAVTFSGSSAATFTTSVTSDPIALQIDAAHDYYVMAYFDPTSGNLQSWQSGAWASGNFGAVYSGDATAQSSLVSPINPTTTLAIYYQNILVT